MHAQQASPAAAAAAAGGGASCFTVYSCCQALEKAGGVVENITWELFKETLLEQAEQVGCKKGACGWQGLGLSRGLSLNIYSQW